MSVFDAQGRHKNLKNLSWFCQNETVLIMECELTIAAVTFEASVTRRIRIASRKHEGPQTPADRRKQCRSAKIKRFWQTDRSSKSR